MKKISLILVSTLLFSLTGVPTASAEVTVSHFIGRGGMGSDDGAASVAKFNRPSDVAMDSNGNSYVLDNTGIRKIDSANRVTTIFKNQIVSGTSYCGITIDKNGDLWYADCRRSVLYKVSSSGTLIRTINLPDPQSTWMSSMHGVAAMSDGSILVTNWFNGKIHKVSSEGSVSTYLQSPVVGNCNSYPKPTGIICPLGVAVSPSNEVYFINSGASGNEILKVNPDNSTTKASSINNPNTIKFTNGALYAAVGDPQGRTEWRLYRVNNLFDSQVVLTRSDYYRWTANGFAFTDANNLVLTASELQVVRKINITSGSQTLVGNINFGLDDGNLSTATTSNPSGITEDSNGNIYFMDFGGIRKISKQGVVSTILKFTSNLSSGYSGLVYENQKLHFIDSSQLKTIDLNGNLQRSLTLNITGDYPLVSNNTIAASSNGEIYILMSRANDYSTKFIRKYDASGNFKDLSPLITNSSDVKFILDKNNNLIVASSGQIKRYVGDNLSQSTVIGSFFGYGQNLALTANNEIFVISRDQNISALNLIRANGAIENLINGPADSSINSGSKSGFSTIGGMLYSSSGEIYVSDSTNHSIRLIKYTPSNSSTGGGNNSSGSNSGNTTNTTKPEAPTFRLFNVSGNTLNLQLNVNLGSKKPDNVYLIAPELGITNSNKSFAKIAGEFANWALPIPTSLNGKDIKLQFFSVKEDVESEALERTIRIPASAPKSANTSVPLPAANAKSVVSTTKVVITADVQPKTNAMPRSGYLTVPDSGITAENPLLGKLSGGKITFTLPVLPSMSGNKIKVQIFLVNEMGDSKALSLGISIPKPTMPKVVTPTVPKVQTVICRKGNQTRTFSGKSCPPGWN